MKRALSVLFLLALVLVSSGCGINDDYVIMPDLLGQRYSDVIKGDYKDFRFDFDYGRVEDLMFSDYPKGTVCFQDTQPGTLIPPNAKVKVRVSKGKEQIQVPDVYGMAFEEAKELLEAAGFGVVRIMKQSGDVEEGCVAATKPPKGAMRDKGAEVSVYVASGPPWVAVPNVVGRTEKEAREAIKAAEFRIEVIYKAADAPAGTVVAQSPAAGAGIDGGAIVTIVVSEGI